MHHSAQTSYAQGRPWPAVQKTSMQHTGRASHAADGLTASEGAHVVFVYWYGPRFVAALQALCCAISSSAASLLNDSVLCKLRRWLTAPICAFKADIQAGQMLCKSNRCVGLVGIVDEAPSSRVS